MATDNQATRDKTTAPDAVLTSMETETDPLPDAVAAAWDCYEGYLTLDQICQECDVSRETARRVLTNLERRGLIEVHRIIQWENQTDV